MRQSKNGPLSTIFTQANGLELIFVLPFRRMQKIANHNCFSSCSKRHHNANHVTNYPRPQAESRWLATELRRESHSLFQQCCLLLDLRPGLHSAERNNFLGLAQAPKVELEQPPRCGRVVKAKEWGAGTNIKQRLKTQIGHEKHTECMKSNWKAYHLCELYQTEKHPQCA